jgi:hypothetical protein
VCSGNESLTVAGTGGTDTTRRLLLEHELAGVAGFATLHKAVQAYLQGDLGIAYSGGGFR